MWLPWPPSVNNLFSQNKGGRRFPSKRYRAWIKAADGALLMQRPKQFGSVSVKMRLLFTPPDAKRRDIDNFSKATIDAIVRAGVIDDDSQVMALSSEWYRIGEPCVRVQIEAGTAVAREAAE